jgi:tetratricopeptide (TPR) repeat protein
VATLIVAWLPLAPAAPRSVGLVNLGAAYAEAGDDGAARAAFSEALRIDPRDARALENLAVLEFRASRYAEALGPVERALAIDPRAFAAWSLRGAVLGKLGRFDEAVESLEHALEIHPQWEDARLALAAVWRDYLSHCQEVAAAAGVAPPGPGEDPRAFVEFLESHGLKRAAERVRRVP